jgi:butyryl-CoA dehydrogenase
MTWIDGFAFDLSDEDILVQQTARDFAEKEIAPIAAKLDHEHRFPSEIIPQLGALGFMGVTVPEEFGGSALSQVAYCLIIEELAAACASTAVIVSAHNSLCLSPIVDYGTPDQKQRFLPDLASGKKIGCFALSEPGTGSDAARLAVTVKKDGGKYIINGTKNWISNAPEADVCILFANQEPSKGHAGITAFVHDLKIPGIEIGKKEDKLGICASPTASIMYNDVVLDEHNILGVELGGFKVAMTTLNGGRTGVAAQAVGIARAALRDALNYSKERSTFGKKICEHQTIQNYLADMVTKIDAARYLTLGAARLKDKKQNYIRAAAMAKLYASETAMEVSIKGVQIHGGYGYVKEFPAERHMRDAKITEIYEGTSEIQRLIIAEQLIRE